MSRLNIILLVLFLGGCGVHKTQPVVGPSANPGVLGFLIDGQTPRETALTKLGSPSRDFEGRRVLTYRLGRRYERVGSLAQASYSLILIFDGDGVLAEHGLVRLR